MLVGLKALMMVNRQNVQVQESSMSECLKIYPSSTSRVSVTLVYP